MTVMNKLTQLFLALLGLAAMALTSCNTMAGFGRDVQSAGEAIHDSASR
jgi:predicted small secreted protein